MFYLTTMVPVKCYGFIEENLQNIPVTKFFTKLRKLATNSHTILDDLFYVSNMK